MGGGFIVAAYFYLILVYLTRPQEPLCFFLYAPSSPFSMQVRLVLGLDWCRSVLLGNLSVIFGYFLGLNLG